MSIKEEKPGNGFDGFDIVFTLFFLLFAGWIVYAMVTGALQKDENHRRETAKEAEDHIREITEMNYRFYGGYHPLVIWEAKQACLASGLYPESYCTKGDPEDPRYLIKVREEFGIEPDSFLEARRKCRSLGVERLYYDDQLYITCDGTDGNNNALLYKAFGPHPTLMPCGKDKDYLCTF